MRERFLDDSIRNIIHRLYVVFVFVFRRSSPTVMCVVIDVDGLRQRQRSEAEVVFINHGNVESHPLLVL